MSLPPSSSAAPGPVQGDRATTHAVRGLFQAHARDLERYARRIVRSREAAQDVVQDVFLLVWLARDRVRVGAGMRSYLYLSTRARALNYVKRARREERHAARRGDVGPHDTVVHAEPGEVPTPEDEVGAAIEAVLSTMPPRQRAAATLRIRRQLTVQDIARELGISPRTVELHVARATRTLRDRLPALLAAR
jgi:RNA polymerase sigma-70 factor (ECF subfamily)